MCGMHSHDAPSGVIFYKLVLMKLFFFFFFMKQ